MHKGLKKKNLFFFFSLGENSLSKITCLLPSVHFASGRAAQRNISFLLTPICQVQAGHYCSDDRTHGRETCSALLWRDVIWDNLESYLQGITDQSLLAPFAEGGWHFPAQYVMGLATSNHSLAAPSCQPMLIPQMPFFFSCCRICPSGFVQANSSVSTERVAWIIEAGMPHSRHGCTSDCPAMSRITETSL